jgi:transcriptional regulator with XRE-family HTH domain
MAHEASGPHGMDEDRAIEGGDGGAGEKVMSEVALSLRVLRASRGLSQRGLAEATGVSKSAVARLEAGSLPPGVARWVRDLDALGLEVRVLPARSEDDLVVPPPHRDGAGRQLPAHVLARRQSMPPTWWFVRHGGWGTREAEPEWFWRRR